MDGFHCRTAEVQFWLHNMSRYFETIVFFLFLLLGEYKIAVGYTIRMLFLSSLFEEKEGV